jgi:hypothetical protein
MPKVHIFNMISLHRKPILSQPNKESGRKAQEQTAVYAIAM